MDGLDALLADAAAEAQAKKELASAKKPAAPPRAVPPRVTATKSSDASEPYLRRLKEFIALLLDPAVLDAIASDLRGGRSYDELTKYVAENFLGDYTLTHELHRMEYVVVTADGAERPSVELVFCRHHLHHCGLHRNALPALSAFAAGASAIRLTCLFQK